MKRIGILTYHRSLNYGAVMQAAVLASQLKERLPNTEIQIIDYTSKRMNNYYKLITLYRGKESFPYVFDRIMMYKAFQKGLRDLPLTEEKLITDNYDTFNKWLNGRFDILITGSDAVWNYSKRGLPNPYFLSGDKEAKHFSYAASCNGLGIENFDLISEKDRNYLNQAFKTFHYIGARDLQTEKLVHYVLPEAEVHHNCDPSILLEDISWVDRSLLLSKLQKKYGFNPEKPTIAFMLSNLNGDFREELAKHIREAYGNKYQTVSLYSYNKYADIPYIADLTPQEWSIIFGLFDLTISKYFHGMIFSMLNRTPVIAVGAERSIGGLPNKISDVLGRMELTDFYFPASSSKDVNWNKFMSKISECLQTPPIERIARGITKEKKAGEDFFDQVMKYC